MDRPFVHTDRDDRLVESDELLTSRARSGDDDAFGELYRRHRKSARATARCMLHSDDEVDDAVADAFTGVLKALRNGHGPRDNFRTYLLACVRNGCRSRSARAVPMADETLEQIGPTLEDPERYVEAGIIAKAFSTLNPRWQQALWMSEVEERPRAEVSRTLHLSSNAASALTLRARQAFATAYLSEHVARSDSAICAGFAPQLAAFVRGRGHVGVQLERHLDHCERCSVAVEELRDVNASLKTLVPVAPQLVAAGTVTAHTVIAGSTVTTTTVGGSSFGVSAVGLLAKGLVVALAIGPVLSADAGADRQVNAAPAAQAQPSSATMTATPAPGVEEPSPATAFALLAVGAAATAPEVAITDEPPLLLGLRPINEGLEVLVGLTSPLAASLLAPVLTPVRLTTTELTAFVNDTIASVVARTVRVTGSLDIEVGVGPVQDLLADLGLAAASAVGGGAIVVVGGNASVVGGDVTVVGGDVTVVAPGPVAGTGPAAAEPSVMAPSTEILPGITTPPITVPSVSTPALDVLGVEVPGLALPTIRLQLPQVSVPLLDDLAA